MVVLVADDSGETDDDDDEAVKSVEKMQWREGGWAKQHTNNY